MSCTPGFILCDRVCMPVSILCNGKVDCYDYDDESNCNNTSNHFYQVNYLFMNKRTLNATSFLIFWYSPANGGPRDNFEYLPSISLANRQDWSNYTKWIENTEHRFTNLTPFTTYNVTVYVRLRNSTHVDPPYNYINVTTAEGVPSEPLNVNVTQLNGSGRVEVSWDPPKEAYGILKEYTVYYRAQTISVQQANSLKVSPQEHSLALDAHFEPNITYEYWVRARNSKNESPSSKLVRLTLDISSDIDRLSGLKAKVIGRDSVQVEWLPIKGVDAYQIEVILPQPYPKLNSSRTTDTQFTIGKLVPGVNINIKVSGVLKHYFGRPASVLIMIPGTALPEVPKVSKSLSGSDIFLHWSPPLNTNLSNITYGIYYGTTMDELYESKLRIVHFILLISTFNYFFLLINRTT